MSKNLVKNSRNLSRKGKVMLLQVLLLATLFSCSKKDIQDPSLQIERNQLSSDTLPATSSTSYTLTSGYLFYKEAFEDGTPFSESLRTRFPATYSFQVVSSPLFAGSHSGRFELRDTDPMLHGGTRCELHFDTLTVKNQWYSYAMYFPTVGYEYDASAEILTQWHETPKGTSPSASPSICLMTKADHIWLYVKPTPSTTTKYDLGPIVKNKWHQFVYHIIHSAGTDGKVELWMDGVKVVTNTGANMYSLNQYEFPEYNVGIYKHDWNYDNTTDTHRRVYYIDNIRRGNSSTTYTEIAVK